MPNRKQYYGLDDVGFLGVSVKRSAAEIQTDAKRTSDYIKSLKAGGVTVVNSHGNNSGKRSKTGKVQGAETSAKKRTLAAKAK